MVHHTARAPRTEYSLRTGTRTEKEVWDRTLRVEVRETESGLSTHDARLRRQIAQPSNFFGGQRAIPDGDFVQVATQ